MKTKINIFYHCWLVNGWKELISEQLNLLCSSGLFNACEKLHIGVVATKEQQDEFKKWFFFNYKINKDKIEIRSTTENTFEYITIKWLKEFCDKNDSYVLYFHTKGISAPLFSNEFLIKKSWRNVMEYFNIEKWKDCITKMDEGYDTAGICLNRNTDKPKRKWYYGNFWWATSNYIKLCTPVKVSNDKEKLKRFYYEKWLFLFEGIKPMQKAFCFYHTTDVYTDKLHAPGLYRKDI